MSNLINFYKGVSKNLEGDFIEDILSLSYKSLERKHNYIQWLFPINELSMYNSNSPLLDSNFINEFYTDTLMLKNFNDALIMMLGFYGFDYELSENNNYIVKTPKNFKTHNILFTTHWLRLYNHNYLRLTRILRCLVLLGFNETAISLLNVLKQYYDNYGYLIGEETYNYWYNAVYN